MASRILRRRVATAFGVYGSAALGFLATIVAAVELSKDDFARYALAFGTTALLQLFVDLTVDEVVIKYGNRYAAREDWPRFHRLFRIAMVVKLAGGAAGTLAIVGAAFLSPYIWQTGGVRGALLIASLVPVIQQPEGMAGAVLTLRGRYDVRGAFLMWAMALRLAAIWIGAHFGLLPVFIAIVVAQLISTASISAVAWAMYRRYPRAEPGPLGDDRGAIRAFAIQSTISSGLTSMRTSLPTVLVGVVAKGTQVANFRAAQAPQTAFQSLSAPARLVLLAEQTRDVEHGRADRAYDLLRRYIGVAIAFACVSVPPLWVFMPSLLRFAHLGKYTDAANAFRVMLLVAALQFIFGWTKTYPVSIGRVGMRSLGQLLEVCVLIPGVLVLGSLYGATGAACGMLAGTVVLAVFWTAALARLPRAEALAG